jgi:hypothetical protein
LEFKWLQGLDADFQKGKKESLAVVLEKLCLSRIRDSNMLIIVSHRTAKKYFPVIP